MHVRRGDYLTDPTGRVLPARYYQQALEQVSADTRFVVFSDDIDWCRHNLDLPDPVFVDGNPDWLDLTLMSRCDEHVVLLREEFRPRVRRDVEQALDAPADAPAVLGVTRSVAGS